MNVEEIFAKRDIERLSLTVTDEELMRLKQCSKFNDWYFAPDGKVDFRGYRIVREK